MARLKDVKLPKKLRREEELEEEVFDVGEEEFDLDEEPGTEFDFSEEEAGVITPRDLSAVSDEELMEELKKRGLGGEEEEVEEELPEELM